MYESEEMKDIMKRLIALEEGLASLKENFINNLALEKRHEEVTKKILDLLESAGVK